MANWQRKLNLLPEWNMAKEHKISIEQLALVIADRLLKLKAFDDEKIEELKEELIWRFTNLTKHSEEEGSDIVEWFDDIMAELYDWADQSLGYQGWNGKKVCWVKTV